MSLGPDAVDRIAAERVAAGVAAGERVSVGCLPVALAAPVVSSSRGVCARCGTGVWVSRRVLAVAPDAELVCVACLGRSS